QYAFTRPIVDHMFKNYDGVLKIDGEVGNKKAYDPRSYLKLAEQGMAHRVVEACEALQSEIREALSYGVVKMNVDTDTQYAFTRPIVDHMFKNYDGVLKIDGEVGNKKAYDPRSYNKLAETGMAARVVEACEDLLSAGQSQAG
ncbi:MAG TPA: class II fructose-bisphosphate aldolase, partial [Blastococcus sp.]